MSKFQINSFRLLGLAIMLSLLLPGVSITFSLKAQPVLSAENSSLGGGGTAYLSGVEATFWNPANLMINDHYGNLHITVGNVGLLYQPVLSNHVVDDQFDEFTEIFGRYDREKTLISSLDRNTILREHYANLGSVSQHQSRADFILGGVSWQNNNEAFSIVARVRMASRIEVGRGWYSEEYIVAQHDTTRNFTLNQQKNKLYELSVSYAHEFTFFNGLLARLSKLYVGIAPKIVLGGPAFDATYSGKYLSPSPTINQKYVSTFSMQSSGSYSRSTQEYLTNQNSQQAIANNFGSNSKYDLSGYGLGFDFGLTYLIPLGSKLPTIDSDPQKSVVDKSIRIGFSINDLGIIRYSDAPLTLSSPKDTVSIKAQPQMNTMYIGTDGQILSYFDYANVLKNPLINAEQTDTDAYSKLLPTSINTGFLLQLTRFKFMGDVTLGLNNTAFTTTKLALHLGFEARPLRQIPIRLGTRLASSLPTYFSLGTGIETRHWDLTLGTQIIPQSRSSAGDFTGAAFGGIQLHF